MALIAVGVKAAANFIVKNGLVKAARKYTPGLINKAKNYISKNKLIASGKKVIKPKKGQVQPQLADRQTVSSFLNKNFNKPVSKGGRDLVVYTPKTTAGAASRVNPRTKLLRKRDKALLAVATTAPFLFSNQGKKDTKKQTNGKKPTVPGGTFGQAFAAARKKGEGTLFTFNDKKYVAVTKDDLRKANAKDLNQYLNKLNK
jgi:hypothetical protein